MSRIVRIGAVAATAALTASLGTVNAFAAPVNAPKAEPLTVKCDNGLGTFTIVPAPGNGEWTPGFLVGTRKVLVPYRFTFTFSDGTTTETESTLKKAPLPANSVTCSFGDSFTEDGVTYTFTGTATGPLRGKP